MPGRAGWSPPDPGNGPAVELLCHHLDATVERLTRRELEVLRLVADGQTNAEMADRLAVSVGTVKFHVKNIIAKLGVAHRTQAAVRAVEFGLLTATPP